MNWIIDRIEGDLALCEVNDKIIDIPLSVLPHGAKEGDIITLGIDTAQRDDRQKRINNLMNNLFKD